MFNSKHLKLGIILAAMTGMSLVAQAQFGGDGRGGRGDFRGDRGDFRGDRGDWRGDRGDHGRDRRGGSYLCQGLIQGIWAWKGGRDLSVTLNQRFGDQVEVITSQRNGSTSSPGTCQEDFRSGMVNVVFNGQSNGNLSIDRSGHVVGVIQGLRYEGQMQGIRNEPPRPIDPQPPVMPPPRPPRPMDLCSGNYVGNWNWKGGREVTVSIARTGFDQVNVTVGQRNGVWTVPGTCTQDYRGAFLNYSANNGGSFQISQDGVITGVMQGLRYDGRRM